MSTLQLTDIRFIPGNEAQNRTGLLAFVSAVLNGELRVSGITVRRTRSGELTVAFPARKDQYGISHGYVAPLNERVRQVLQSQILKALRSSLGLEI